MPRNIKEALDAILRAQDYVGKPHHPPGPRPLITIARDLGSGGEAIGHQLAEILEVPYFDQEILERITRAARADRALVKALDDRFQDRWGMWLYTMLSGEQTQHAEYMRHLVNIILGLADGGGVIMGRGAHIILQAHRAFRLRVCGSPQACAARLVREEGGEPEVRLLEVEETNRHRARFIWENYHQRLNDPLHFDLVLNTDRFGDLKAATQVLLDAFRAHAASWPAPLPAPAAAPAAGGRP